MSAAAATGRLRAGRLRAAWLPGRRLHLQDGPIDLVVEARGPGTAVRGAYLAAARALDGLLDGLCAELPSLRAPAGTVPLDGPVARRMGLAVAPYAAETFVTPMAAVAGAVAETVLDAMRAAAPHLTWASVNNGGDVALHLAPGEHVRVGLAAGPAAGEPALPDLFGAATIRAEDGIAGVATSGWQGRSHSLGIADAVTVLARTAPEADAAATIVANAVDLPGHPGVRRVPARDLQPDSDLGARLVTRAVAALAPTDVAVALARGAARAEDLRRRGLIRAAALHLRGETRLVGVDEARLDPAGAGLALAGPRRAMEYRGR